MDAIDEIPTTTARGPRYPGIRVHLSGNDGNAWAIIGRCLKAMRKARLGESTLAEFRAEAFAGDYDHLLRTCMAWFDCD